MKSLSELGVSLKCLSASFICAILLSQTANGEDLLPNAQPPSEADRLPKNIMISAEEGVSPGAGEVSQGTRELGPITRERGPGTRESGPGAKELAQGTAKERMVAVPRAIAGVVAGLTVGVPVRITKDVRRETKRIADTLRSDVGNDHGLLETVFVAGGAVSFGLLGGTIMGTIRGTEHAITYGSHQPFSKESLGLKEVAQEPERKQQ